MQRRMTCHWRSCQRTKTSHLCARPGRIFAMFSKVRGNTGRNWSTSARIPSPLKWKRIDQKQCVKSRRRMKQSLCSDAFTQYRNEPKAEQLLTLKCQFTLGTIPQAATNSLSTEKERSNATRENTPSMAKHLSSEPKLSGKRSLRITYFQQPLKHWGAE